MRALRMDAVGDVSPGCDVDENAGDLKGTLDLGDMGEADALEGKAHPCVLGTGAEGVSPEVVVTRGSGKEFSVEEGEGVEELPERAFFCLAERRVLADESALLELEEGSGEGPAVGEPGSGEEGGAVRADADGGKGIGDFAVEIGVAEERGVKGVELGGERGRVGEKEGIEVLGDGEAFFEETPVPGNAAEDHVGGTDVTAGE